MRTGSDLLLEVEEYDAGQLHPSHKRLHGTPRVQQGKRRGEMNPDVANPHKGLFPIKVNVLNRERRPGAEDSFSDGHPSHERSPVCGCERVAHWPGRYQRIPIVPEDKGISKPF